MTSNMFLSASGTASASSSLRPRMLSTSTYGASCHQPLWHVDVQIQIKVHTLFLQKAAPAVALQLSHLRVVSIHKLLLALCPSDSCLHDCQCSTLPKELSGTYTVGKKASIALLHH